MASDISVDLVNNFKASFMATNNSTSTSSFMDQSFQDVFDAVQSSQEDISDRSEGEYGVLDLRANSNEENKGVNDNESATDAGNETEYENDSNSDDNTPETAPVDEMSDDNEVEDSATTEETEAVPTDTENQSSEIAEETSPVVAPVTPIDTGEITTEETVQIVEEIVPGLTGDDQGNTDSENPDDTEFAEVVEGDVTLADTPESVADDMALNTAEIGGATQVAEESAAKSTDKINTSTPTSTTENRETAPLTSKQVAQEVMSEAKVKEEIMVEDGAKATESNRVERKAAQADTILSAKTQQAVITAPTVTEKPSQTLQVNAANQYTKNSVEATETAETAKNTPSRAAERNVLGQIVEKARIHVKANGTSNMTLRLDPPNLGKVDVRISVEDNVVKAVLMADSKEVKAIIEQNLGNLKNSMNASGLKVEEITVTTSDQGGLSFAGETGSGFGEGKNSSGSGNEGFDGDGFEDEGTEIRLSSSSFHQGVLDVVA